MKQPKWQIPPNEIETPASSLISYAIIVLNYYSNGLNISSIDFRAALQYEIYQIVSFNCLP